MTLFDSYVMVDWSSSGKPSRRTECENALWIGTAGIGAEEPRYCRTRAAAMDWLIGRLAGLRAAGRRVLVGFDFPFGYPQGFAAALTGRAEALAVWEALAGLVADRPDNSNDRFHVAGRLNARLAGVGPFWGNGLRADVEGLPRTKAGWGTAGLAEFRWVERDPDARGAKSCWQISGAGAVGGQVLTGMPALWRLRQDPRLAADLAVWPFETGLEPPRAPLVLAEIYPSLWRALVRATGDKIADRAQVRIAAEQFALLDREGALGALFGGPCAMDPADRAVVAAEEGWILGVGRGAR